MDKRVIAFFLIALLGGLFGGFGLGYVIYQPQIQNLQDDLGNLSEDLHDLNGDITSIQNQVSSYNSNLTTINSSLEDLQSSMATLNTELDSISSKVADLQSQLSTLNTEQSTLNNRLEELSLSLTNLQSLLSSFNTRLSNLENRSWHEVYFVGGSTNVTSDVFQLKGKEFRVMLTSVGQDALSLIMIVLRFSNGTAYSYWSFSGISTATNVEEDLEQSGEYYLEVISDQTDYYIILWDYY